MALITCRECNKQISDTAKICPSCGVKNPLNAINWALYIVPFIVLLAVALYYGNNVNTPAPPLEKEAENVPEIKVIEEVKATENDTESVIEQLPIENTWQYAAPIDEVSGKEWKVAYLKSINSATLSSPYAGQTDAYINVRKHPRFGNDISIQVDDGQLHCQYNNCYVSVRFDNGNILKNNVSGPTDNSYTKYFFSNYKKMLSNIKNSKKMYVELTFFQQGSTTFEFNTENLDLSKITI